MRPSLPAVPLLALACALAVPSAGPARAAAGAPVPAQAVPAATAGPKLVLPFIRDDYARALAEARARRLPLFIEAWAPW